MATKTKEKEPAGAATIEVTGVTKGTIVKTGERNLNVEAVITDGNEKHIRKYSYPLDTDKETIEADLEKALALYEQEKAQTAARADADKADATADKTIEALTGKL